jgi:hypothetical protein
VGLAPNPFPFGGAPWIDGGGSLFLTLDSSQIHLVPEPSTVAFVGLGILMLAVRRRYRQTHHQGLRSALPSNWLRNTSRSALSSKR